MCGACDAEACTWSLYGHTLRRKAFFAYELLCAASGAPEALCTIWNDMPERTVADIIALCQRVVRAAQQSEADRAAALALPTFEGLYAFLKGHYRSEIFEGVDNSERTEHSMLVTRSMMSALENEGYSCVSEYESKAHQGFFFDRNLQVLEGERLKRAHQGRLK